MRLEDLNKNQIILLTLLTSFVTSIATGIVTVSLLEQAPPGVTQTINRVVERTIEKVVPEKIGSAVVTKETTVVVKEDDLVAKAIQSGTSGLVQLYTKGEAGVLIALGVILNSSGTIATDADVVHSDIGTLYAVTADGKTFDTVYADRDGDNRIQLLSIVQKPEKPTTFTSVTLASTDGVRLGQSVIVIGGGSRRIVGTGIVSSLVETSIQGAGTSSPSTAISSIEASVSPSGGLTGAPLLNVFGEVIGLNEAGEEGRRNSYVPVRYIKSVLTSPKESKKP